MALWLPNAWWGFYVTWNVYRASGKGRGSCVWGSKGHLRGHLLEHWILSFFISIDTSRQLGTAEALVLSGAEAGGRAQWAGRGTAVYSAVTRWQRLANNQLHLSLPSGLGWDPWVGCVLINELWLEDLSGDLQVIWKRMFFHRLNVFFKV